MNHLIFFFFWVTKFFFNTGTHLLFWSHSLPLPLQIKYSKYASLPALKSFPPSSLYLNKCPVLLLLPPEEFLNPSPFSPATAQGTSKADLDSSTSSHPCQAPVSPVHSSHSNLERNMNLTTHPCLKTEWPLLNFRMKRKPVLILQGWEWVAHSGRSYPASRTALFPVLLLPHSHLRAVFFPTLSASLSIWRHLSIVSSSGKHSLTSYYTFSCHHAPTSTSRQPQVNYTHFVTPCPWWMPASLTRPQDAWSHLSSSPQPCSWHVSMHPPNGPFLGKSEKYLLVHQAT